MKIHWLLSLLAAGRCFAAASTTTTTRISKNLAFVPTKHTRIRNNGLSSSRPFGATATVTATARLPSIAPSAKIAASTFAARRSSRGGSANNGGLAMTSSAKEEEIAKLEQQLRQLKEEAEQEEIDVEEIEVEAPASTSTTTNSLISNDSDDFVGRGPAKRPVKPMEGMMSESWKEESDGGAGVDSSDSGSGGLGGTVTTIAAGLVFAAFLAFFSQIPVGQEDLGKYQAIKTNMQIDLGDRNPLRSSD